MEILRKSLGYSLKAANESDGILEAIVNTLTLVDRTDERTMPGIFNESISKKLPRGVWHHRWDQPIAKTLEASEIPAGDSRLPEESRAYGGLYIKAQFFPDIEDSWQAFLKIKAGLIDEFSIGYRMIETSYNQEEEVLNLIKGEWYEWSPVLVGANQATSVLSIKSSDGLTLQEETDAVLDAAENLTKRLESHAEKRIESKGRLSQASIDRLDSVQKRLEAIREVGNKSSLRAEFDREYLAFLKTQSGVKK